MILLTQFFDRKENRLPVAVVEPVMRLSHTRTASWLSQHIVSLT